MIEKLDIKNGGVEDLLNCIKKINELVDAVNGMLCWHENLPRFWQNLLQKENTENEDIPPHIQCDSLRIAYKIAKDKIHADLMVCADNVINRTTSANKGENYVSE
ncbi:MAG: hypothetical protein J6S67_23275 [Methanobrevibacter sp.]|nr:hypothetical protein [Methanobrevibacter sp.]